MANKKEIKEEDKQANKRTVLVERPLGLVENINKYFNPIIERGIDLENEENIKILLKYPVFRMVKFDYEMANMAYILTLIIFVYLEQILRWETPRKLYQLGQLRKAYDPEPSGEYAHYFSFANLKANRKAKIVQLLDLMISWVKGKGNIEFILNQLETVDRVKDHDFLRVNYAS